MNRLVLGGGAWTDSFAGVTGCGRVAGGLVGHVHGVEAVLIKHKRENRDQAGRRPGDLTKRGGRVRAEAPVRAAPSRHRPLAARTPLGGKEPRRVPASKNRQCLQPRQRKRSADAMTASSHALLISNVSLSNSATERGFRDQRRAHRQWSTPSLSWLHRHLASPAAPAHRAPHDGGAVT